MGEATARGEILNLKSALVIAEELLKFTDVKSVNLQRVDKFSKVQISLGTYLESSVFAQVATIVKKYSLDVGVYSDGVILR